jgi:serine/threonine protein kinase
MHYAFQDKDNLFIVMDYLSGGDLRYHICKQKKFNEEQSSKQYFYFRILHCLFNTCFGIPSF